MDATGGNGLLTDYVTPAGFTTRNIITSLSPADGATYVAISSGIIVSFAEAMDTTTLTSNYTDTSCSGSIQVSFDSFATCVRMSAGPAASNGDKTFSLQPAVELEGSTTYQIKITSAVIDATGGNAVVNDYTTGFTTREAIPPKVSSVCPGNSVSDVAPDTPIYVTFDETMDVSTITTNTTGTNCSGCIQVSNDDFSSCETMSSIGAVDASNISFKLLPVSDLGGGSTYKIRVTTSAKDVAGNNMLNQDTTSTGFSTVSGFSQVSGGLYHTCAVLSDNKVKCWGYGYPGQLGNGNTSNQPTPVEVTGISTATQVSAGYYHTCAVLSDNKVNCWGDGGYGQLGNGSTLDQTTPVEVTGISTATQVSGGRYHTCAVLSDNKVKCWGYGYPGQLGNGNTSNQPTPVEVTGISTATQVSAGYYHTCAVLSDNKVNCWGDGGYGQLGNGSTLDQTTPVEVTGISTATQVSGGRYHTCAVLSDNKVNCWGDGSYGQLGDSQDTYSQTTPVAVDYSPNGFTCPVPGAASSETVNGSGSTAGGIVDLSFNIPVRTTSIRMKLEMKGDFGQSSEYVTVYFNDNSLGDADSGGECSSSYETPSGWSDKSIDSSYWTAGSVATVKLDASSSVDVCTPFYEYQVTLTYE